MHLNRRVDRYELLEEVGSGGMAVVYRGHDTALDREVAVKLLHPHLAARAESRARFSREARAVARLKHPAIVEIFDYAGEAAVESYLVTEFVRGRTLRLFAEQERLAQPEIAALVVRTLADALAHAHAAGVVHRDLKPENVLVAEAGHRALKLVDFGIARLLASDERMTMTGALVGSPNHMAPEIIAGREADARSDVFSLGTILYWLATGQLPFAAPNPTATLRRVIDGDYVDPRRAAPAISDDLAAVIVRSLATDPERRTPSAAQLRDELDAALAAAGLDEPGVELAALLADLAGYRARLPARLVDSALRRADAALAAGDTATGMRLLDRVLALDPGNAAVSERLARVSAAVRRRRRLRAAMRIAVPAIAVALAAWALAPRGRPPRGPAPTPSADPRRVDPVEEVRAAPSAPNPPPGAAAPALRPSPTEDAAIASLPASRAREGAASAASTAPRSAVIVARSVQVQLHVRPYAQRALLDGVEVARGDQRVVFTFSTGSSHRIQVEHACCFPFVRDFAPGEAIPQPLELKVPLRPRPARLRVEADPSTRVYVDGQLVGTAGDSQRAPLEVPVPAGGDTPYEAPAELALEREGTPRLVATVRIRAGADLAFAAAPLKEETP